MAPKAKPSKRTGNTDRSRTEPQQETKREPGVGIDINCMPFFNYALAHVLPTPVHSIFIDNNTLFDVVGLTIVVDSKTDLLIDTEIRIDRIPAGEAIEIDASFIHIDAERILQLTEMMTDELNFKFIVDDKVVFEDTRSIDFFAFDEWLGMLQPESLAAFVTPNHPALSQVIINASKYLGEWTGDPAFDGYQSGDPTRARMQAAAIFRAVQEWGIVYVGAPPSFGPGQRIRMPDAVLEQHMATCLDFAVLYAALLEAVSLRPLIVLIEGHAFSGVWLEEASFQEFAETDCASLLKRCAKGIEQITVLQSTDMAQGADVTFEQAEQTGRLLLNPATFQLAIDVWRAHVGGILPLPIRVKGDKGWTIDVENSALSAAQAPTKKQTSKEFIDVVDAPKTKQQLWERSLLDLSMHNNLLNMHMGPRAIPIYVPSLDEVEDTLALNNDLIVAPRPLEFPNLSEKDSYAAIDVTESMKTLLYAEYKDGRLRTPFTEAALKRNLDNLYRSAKSSLEETGSNTLFLALGLLKWVDSRRSNQIRLAPIMLFPIDIIRKSAKAGYIIRLRDDEPQINISLIEMLRADYEISIDGLDPLPLDDAGVDTRLVLNTFVNKVMNQEGWEVLEAATLGLFSFSQFVMWNDIRSHEKELRNSKVVDSMIEGHLTWTPTMLDPDKPVDPSELLLPVEADASQMYAIKAALENNTFILHGPPGTGKSQTITAIIANALARGKKVLFVAEKMAALEVVEKRLAALGLSPFCLEVHSTKATKNHVLEQVQTAIELGKVQKDDHYALKLQEVKALRNKLDLYAKGLQTEGKSGLTLREAIAAYTTFEGKCEPMQLSGAFAAGLENPIDFSEKMNFAEQLIIHARGLAPLSQHPLHEITGQVYSQEMVDSLPKLVESCRNSMQPLQESANQLASALGIAVPRTRSEYAQAEALASDASQIGTLDASWLQVIGNTSLIAQLSDLAARVAQMEERRQNILASRKESFFDLDVDAMRREWSEAQSKGIFSRNKAIQAFLAQINAHMKNPLSQDQVDDALVGLESFKRYQASLNTTIQAASTYLSGFMRLDGSVDWPAFRNRLERVANLDANRQTTARMLANCPDSAAAIDACATFRNLLQQANNAVANLESSVGAFDLQPDAAWPEAVVQACDALSGNNHLLHEWMIWNKMASMAHAKCLDDLIGHLSEHAVTESTINEFKCGVYRSLCVRGIDQLSGMNSFTSEGFGQLVKQYTRADEELRRLAKQQIYYEVASRMPNLTAMSATDSAAANLQKALKSRGRSVSIRSVISESGDVVRALCPCFLMSPLSVAQYLEPGKQEFDLLIFDEASQLQTCKAVGALSRAKSAVIVGDPRQMPPTSFFQGKVSGEDYEEVSDLESVLEDCLALNLPQTYLKWHYRSQHESLIAFSNKRFYESKMLTFPSADDQNSRVEFVHVDGYFDRGGKRVNEAEAKAIVAELQQRAKDPLLQSQSVGIVTFNIPQQSLIEDLLQEACAKDPEFEKWTTSGSEPLFVKNLENVQGDERDAILFSITYAPDAAGKMSMNFGPINREGGWRRLNVAVTRARMSMKVFSSMTASDIDLNRTSSMGPSALKSFLAYAQRGAFDASASGTLHDNSLNDAIAAALCEKLEQHGYQTRQDVGRSSYRVDVAVVDPYDPAHYLAGILLDGDSYELAETTRDREVSQPKLLERLGWKICRMRALEWWGDPEGTVQEILEFLDSAKEEAKERAEKLQLQKPVAEKETESASAPPTEPASISEPAEAIGAEAPDEPQDEPEPASEPDDAADPAPTPSAIREAEPAAAPEPEARTEAPIEVETTPNAATSADSLRQPYIQASLEANPLDASEFASLENAEIARVAERILETEAPIEQSLLIKRIATHYGISRVGNKIQEKCELAIKRAACKKVTQAGRAIIWRPDQDPKTYLAYRVSDDEASRRDFLELPLEEIVAASIDCLRELGETDQTSLVKSLATKLGYKRVTAKMTDFAKKAVTLGVRRNLLERDGDSLKLAAQPQACNAAESSAASQAAGSAESKNQPAETTPASTAFEPGDFVFLDVETPNRKQNSICQIGVIRTDGKGTEKARLSTLVNPDDDFDATNTSVHGITERDVVNSPTFDKLWESELGNLLANARIIGHNVHFDIAVLDKLLDRYGIEHGGVEYACTMSLAGECCPDLDNYRLETVCAHCGIELSGHHDAFADAKASMDVFFHLDQRYGVIGSSFNWSTYTPMKQRVDSTWKPSAQLTETSKAMQELILLAEDVISDGVVTIDEAVGLRWWIERNPVLGDEGLSAHLLESLNQVLLDGVIDAEEQSLLLGMLKQLVNPLDSDAVGDVDFDGKRFCLSGDFEYGDKSAVEAALVQRGGIPLKSVTKACDYVIVGAKGSDRYAFGNYGAKVAKALEMQEQGSSIKVLSESDIGLV